MGLIGNVIHFFITRQARNSTVEGIKLNLQKGGEAITMKINQAADTPDNRNSARHIIGIERWGLHRLQSVFNNCPPDMDEYDDFCPSAELALPLLANEFQAARSETLDMVEKLSPYRDKIVPHNDLGEISVKAWLIYLSGHSKRELQKIK
jgi:hypothetical protein